MDPQIGANSPRMMSRRAAAGLMSAAALTAPSAARARPLQAFEQRLMDRDAYFQPMDEPAAEFALDDADGLPVTLRSLRGKAVVLNSIYTNCPDICPLQTERMAEFQRLIEAGKIVDRVQLVTITADPVRDTPDTMKLYAKQHGIAPPGWLFLTSGPDRPELSRDVSARYHSRFRPEPDGSITHAAVFQIVDGEGRWRGNFHGLKWPPKDLVSFVAELTQPTSSSPSLLQRLKRIL